MRCGVAEIKRPMHKASQERIEIVCVRGGAVAKRGTWQGPVYRGICIFKAWHKRGKLAQSLAEPGLRDYRLQDHRTEICLCDEGPGQGVARGKAVFSEGSAFPSVAQAWQAGAKRGGGAGLRHYGLKRLGDAQTAAVEHPGNQVGGVAALVADGLQQRLVSATVGACRSCAGRLARSAFTFPRGWPNTSL